MPNILQSEADPEVVGVLPLEPGTEADVPVLSTPTLTTPSANSNGQLTLRPPLLGATAGPAPSVPHAGIDAAAAGDAEASMALVPLEVHALSTPVPPADRRWLKIVAVIVTFAVLAAVAVWGWTQHSLAADWKARAGDLETELASTQSELNNTLASLAETQDELDSTEDTLSDTQGQLAAVEEQLSATEAQVEALDAQVATLANTKAQVEDERAQLSAILATAPAVTTALRACASSNVAVSVELLEVIEGYPYRPLSAASSLLDDALEICEDAIGKANDFEATLSALGL